mgnify:FL=1
MNMHHRWATTTELKYLYAYIEIWLSQCCSKLLVIGISLRFHLKCNDKFASFVYLNTVFDETFDNILIQFDDDQTIWCFIGSLVQETVILGHILGSLARLLNWCTTQNFMQSSKNTSCHLSKEICGMCRKFCFNYRTMSMSGVLIYNFCCVTFSRDTFDLS